MAPKKKQAAAAQESESGTTDNLPSFAPSANPIDTFSVLQAAAEADTIQSHIQQFQELMGSAESPSTPLLMRVRFLEFIGRNLSKVDEHSLQKIVFSLVKIISTDDNKGPLLCAAIRCFESLGPMSTTNSSLEYLAREGVDVLLQITLDHGGFELAARKAAMAALDALTETAFGCVVAKLFHWISDDREADEEEQLRKERHTAISRLLRLALSPSMGKHWTDKTQEDTISFIKLVFHTVDAREFTQLIHMASSLPVVRDKGGAPLLEWFIEANNSTLSERDTESLGIISRFVKDTVAFDLASYLEKVGALQADLSVGGESAVHLSRVICFGSKVSPSESTAALVAYVFNQIHGLIGGGAMLTCDFSVLEALLLSVVFLSRKNGSGVLAKMNEEEFPNKMKVLSETLTTLENQTTFAVKKMVQAGEAKASDAELLACVSNCKNLTAQLAQKQITAGVLSESWNGKAKLPVARPGKRSREESKNSLPLPNSENHHKNRKPERFGRRRNH